MPEVKDWVSREELLRQLRKEGYRVSKAQLKRWHRARLVEPPRRKPLGRGRGTVSEYPQGALLQAAAVAHLLRQVRDLEMVEWYLWCYGLLRASRGRAFLQRAVRTRVKWAQEALRAYEREERDSLVDGVARGPLPATLGRLRRKFRAEDLLRLQQLWRELAAGSTGAIGSPYEDDLLLLVRAGQVVLGGGNTDKKELREVKDLLERHGPRVAWPLLEPMAKAFSGPNLLQALDRISDRDLNRLRNEARTLLQHHAGLPDDADLLMPPGVFLLYFAVRYAGPEELRRSSAQRLKEKRKREEIPPPLPAPFDRIVGDVLKDARTAAEKHRAKGK